MDAYMTGTHPFININDIMPQATTKTQKENTDVKHISKRNASKHCQFSDASDQPAPDVNQIFQFIT